MYALNTKKGSTVNHPDVSLPGLTAVPVSDKLANQLKHIINVVVFDKIAGREPEKKKELYNINKNTLEKNVKPKLINSP